VLVEEAEAVQANLERPAGRALLAQLEQIAADFLFAELIGRAPVPHCQPAHRLGVGLSCPQSQTRQDHVLDHPLT
jgi:hypothetical protein